ncbi:hypothetical protein B0I37DRAFT_415165 [Chaetomium sp. MPI-CAGE-AT-0009]|nr:hypothetical protein B0I37DRAFT_415165 [Chaetomium sp. MPI-CAGE-AT-0009]
MSRVTQAIVTTVEDVDVVCCPSGLTYTETLLPFAPGVGGWCLGTLTSILNHHRRQQHHHHHHHPQPNPSPTNTDTTTIVASVTAGTLVLACLAAAISFSLLRRRRNRQQHHQTTTTAAFPPFDTDTDARELHSTSSARTELLGDTNPSVVTHELGVNVRGPVELDAVPLAGGGGGGGGEVGGEGRW